MMTARNIGNNSKNNQTAFATHTSSAAETSFTTATAALSGGAVGKPLRIMCSGSITGIVQLNYGANSSKQVAVIPNGSPVELSIPAGAFPNKVNSVPVSFECTGGVGTLVAVVEFSSE